MNKINTCLWFDQQAEDAAKFYTSLFEPSRIGKIARYGESGAEVSGQKKGSVMTVDFQLENMQIMGLNGGPQFQFTPAISFLVWRKLEKEIEPLWKELSRGGSILFELQKYPWAEKYGWCTDRFGVPWQVMLLENKRKIAPSILFTGNLFGKGEEAIKFYTSVFKNSRIGDIHRDPQTSTVMFGEFFLEDQEFVLMEGTGKPAHEISLATSFVVNCKDQKEVDYFWEKLSADRASEQCGWLKDKFGVSWQIVPEELNKLMSDADPVKVEKTMTAMLKMKKLDVAKLKEAYGS